MKNNRRHLPKLKPHPGSEARALDLLRAGRLGEAATLFRGVVDEDPQHWRGLHLLGLIAHKQRQFPEAAELISQALQVKPDLAEGHSDLGVVLKEMGKFEEAKEACERAIDLKPGFHPAYSNLGNIHKAQGKLEDAALWYRKALEVEPTFADALINLANVLVLVDRVDEALVAGRRAVALAPNHADAHVVLGHALRQAGELDEAMTFYIRALELRPEYGPVYSDLGCLLSEMGQHEEACEVHAKALQFAPDYAEAYNNLGIALRGLGRYEESAEHYRRAIKLKPDYAEAWSNLGTTFDLMGRHGEAVDAYRRAVAIKPDMAVAYVNLGGSLWEQNKIAEAISAYGYSLSLDPTQHHALVDLYNLRRNACDWRDLGAQETKILADTYRRGKAVAPFPLLNIQGDPAEEQICAREWAKTITKIGRPDFEHAALPSAANPRRLRIGYLSADFCRHATAALISELIERHDRARFEVFAFSYGRDDRSDMRARLIKAFDTFVDLQDLPHPEAARRIHADGIDILVDLKGYTTSTRTEILAHRPAPIQVNYLGYPGTMGAPFIDYLIADSFIVPRESQDFYDEQVVWLPNCYQPNDTKRRIAPNAPSRAECGLPATGFVFCCFNNTYKITPEIFDVWARLLLAVPGSVLWLLEANALVKENLRREAIARGADPDRLVFAPKIDLGLHLARHAHADLFLDTLPVNAHTTASDALWAGLPVLTCAGKSFASRVAGSLLRAVGLPELVTDSLADYEAAALRLARDPAGLAAVRAKLVQNRESASLFDIDRYTRDLEAAYLRMAEIGAAGDAPRAFAVADPDGAASLAGLAVGTRGSAGALATAVSSAPKPAPTAEMPIAAAPVMPAPATVPPAAPAIVTAAPAPAPVSADKAVTTLKPAILVTQNAQASVLKEPRVAYSACPLCSSRDITRFKEADCTRHPVYQPALPPTMAWCRCGNCAHVFTEGYFTPEAAAVIFSKTMPHQAIGHDIEGQRPVSARIVERVARYAPSGEWLDIGCGNGSLLFTAQEWGYTPVGVDLRATNVQALAKLGFEAHCTPVEELNFPGRFTVISMADVLEHIPYPRPALEAVHRLMKEGGVLFISMPNMDNMIWRAMDASKANPYWGEIEHYHNFSRTRLYTLLESQGFTPLQYAISERYRACMEVIAIRR